jgi:hypothetical protein
MKVLTVVVSVVAMIAIVCCFVLISKVCNTPEIDGGKHKLCINIVHKDKGSL